MKSKKLKVALCFEQPLAMDAYSLLIETVAHAKVVARSTSGQTLARQVKAAGVDILLIETGLAVALADSSLAKLLGDAATPRVALVVDGEPIGDGLSHLAVVSNKQELVALLGGEPPSSDSRASAGKGDEPIDIESLGITRREREVWQLIAEGLAVREVGESLGLAESTIDSHKSRLMRKLGIHKSLDLVRLAVRLGIIDP